MGRKWHCDEVFHKILGEDRWLFAVMDSATRYILAWDESDTKSGYKPLPLFLAAHKLAGLDPWIFVADGLAAFVKAAPKTFRGREGFRLLHMRDIHLRNIFNTSNIYERLNGEFKARIKTAKEFNLKPNKKTDGKIRGRMSRPDTSAYHTPQLLQAPLGPERQDAGQGGGNNHTQ